MRDWPTAEMQEASRYLQSCRVVWDLRRYNQHHDIVLWERADAIRQKILGWPQWLTFHI